MTGRRHSTEPTLVIDRELLPPVSRVPGPSIEQLADVERARRDLEECVETLVPCPTCEHCVSCGGHHMVTPSRAVQIAGGGIKTELDEP